MPPILVECPPSNGGDLLLVGTTVVGSGGVDVSFWDGEDFEMLVLSFINAIKNWRFSVRSVGFSININLVLITTLHTSSFKMVKWGNKMDTKSDEQFLVIKSTI